MRVYQQVLDGRGFVPQWSPERKTPSSSLVERAGRRRNGAHAGTSSKRLKGLEPSTFCIASSPTSRTRAAVSPADQAHRLSGLARVRCRISPRFAGILSLDCLQAADANARHILLATYVAREGGSRLRGIMTRRDETGRSSLNVIFEAVQLVSEQAQVRSIEGRAAFGDEPLGHGEGGQAWIGSKEPGDRRQLRCYGRDDASVEDGAHACVARRRVKRFVS
jgi:hypothetical protein